jgi:hypothetical protein
MPFELHNFITFYNFKDMPRTITNSTKLTKPIKIDIDLYKVLLQFKQIKYYAHTNYYGSTQLSMILSTIGLESRVRYGRVGDTTKVINKVKNFIIK